MSRDMQAVTAEAAGIPSAAVAAFIDRLEDRGLPMHSALLLRGERIAAEAYWAPFDASFRHRLYSTTKSFVSVAIGILAGDGRLSLRDRVVDFFPDYAVRYGPVHPYVARTTVRDLLTMTTAFTASNYTVFDDWTEAFFRIPAGHLPGRSFRYDTLATVMLCMIVRRVAGVEFTALLQERLFDPAGMSPDIRCVQTPCGHDWGGSGLLCTTRDLATFAAVCMHGGRWRGQQLVSEDYLREATAPQVDSTITLTDPEHQYGYGYQFWRSRFGFSCRGMGSQLAVCVPEHDLILVTTADTQSITGGDSIIYDALERFILGSLSRGPLPEDPAAQSALQARISGLVLRAVSGERQSPQAAAIDGRTYVMDENGMGLKTVRFHVGADSIAMAYENATGPHEIRFGLGRQVRQSFPETHYYGRTMMRPSGRGYDCHASAAWRRDDSLLMVVYATDEYFGTLRMNAVFAGDTVTLQSDAFAEMFFNEYRGFASGRMRG
ncbi:MAG: serine hydrolase [Lentisphaerae bacterium]|nr:serine hydrolase [Lentisphaerota bacterium]